jgi:multicomponent K+:H+ antiporter subunit D
MIQHIASWPVLIPMLSAILLLMPPCGKSIPIRRVVSITMSLFTSIISIALLVYVYKNGPIVYAIGGWKAPFGIVLVADLLSVLLVALTSFLALSVALYSSVGDDEKGSFFPHIMHFLVVGVNGAYLTGD